MIRFAPLLALISFLFFQTCQAVLASQGEKHRRIVVLETMPTPAIQEYSRWFTWEMQNLGYSLETSEFVILNAQGSRKNAEALLRQYLQQAHPDIVVAIATLAAQAAQAVLPSQIPLVFALVTDPVGVGLVPAIGQASGTNITGRSYSVDKKVKFNIASRLARQVVDNRPVRFGYIASDYPSAQKDFAELNKAATSSKNIQFIASFFPYRAMPEGTTTMLDEVEKRAQSLSSQIDFWWEPTTPLAELNMYTRMLQKRGEKPVLCGGTVNAVKRGALFCMQPDFQAGGRETAVLVNSILSGQDVRTIPVVQATEYTFAINLTTALQLGIVIPSSLLQLAGKNHIFR
ncbi:ABC transporter substrate-binding protein [Desulfovibrio inopinatus]|uniref:ABC transporter substrate-binding protein n=1 Tax=Desulfovibrio inopinatus TaxID=102109 RepID=UPI00040BE133|nr:ABC transporter substrate binding protein [Desulfovibrio inopinatus]